MKKIKVLVVDDSAVIRKVLGDLLSRDPEIELLGAAADPIFAMRRMEAQWPDVIILDVEMPRMDGITFLRKLMSEHPTPVVMCSTLTSRGAETTMQAMAAGAVEIVTKPKLGARDFLQEEATTLLRAVKSAARVRMDRVKPRPAPRPAAPPRYSADAILPPPDRAMARTTEHVVAIGTSTGGTQALETVLTALPALVPGIVVVQHMPEKFTAAFASRLDSLCQVEVREAQNGDRVVPGRVLIAPGGAHMLLRRSGAQYRVEVRDGPLVNRHRPSVDVLFRSVARSAGANALGIIMTGMGDDGAAGLLEMRQAGARTLGQNEATCVVYGMPKEAARRGAVETELPLEAFPEVIVQYGVNGIVKNAAG